MPLNAFHPAVNRWFQGCYAAPTPVQLQAWPAIRQQRHSLIAAPTGSGKTLAAFLSAIDSLVRDGLDSGLPDATQVLYISPLKALSNDIQKNLQEPLNGIRDELLESGLPDVPIRALVRTGDTTQSERERMRRQAPHILATTPESFYLLLSSVSGRDMLRHVRTVIVDEVHALAGNKRGAHLSLSLERLASLCDQAPVRIGLSATQKPIEEMARFLCGAQADDCNIIDTGHVRKRDLQLEIPASALEAIMSNEVWEEIYNRLAQLTEQHRTTLIFVNTRRLAERAAHHLADRIGEDAVTAHHGSLARKHRLQAEQRLKRGELRALVATASLELGIDIGDVDLVCQLGSPRSIATFLQRVGRSGHAVGETPKGHLFPLSRDELVECTALLDAVRREELDRIIVPRAPQDVLAQQIVAEVASREWSETELYTAFQRAFPYRELSRKQFTDVVRMLADGYSTRRGRRGAYLHRDAVNGQLRPRRGARLVALTNGGAIADLFDYDVILQPEGLMVGNLNEDFAFESLPGDIFQLGNTAYRMLKIEQGKVFVEDAHGQPPNIPFWFGEAPGRTDELSGAVSQLRAQLESRLIAAPESCVTWLQEHYKLPAGAARQLVDYLAAARAALGTLPTRDTIVFERFFDETGDLHFVIHAPLGARINRAWGLALRKRFCRKFNFELQAAATDDSVILSLGPTHSFASAEVANYLKSDSVRDILTQALLDAPMFATRWRWNANISLAVPRNRNGKRVPAQFQRSNAEDLVAVIFPDQLACLENISGNREIPDHPLITQTLYDCLHELMDIDGLEKLLARVEKNEISIVTCDLASPSLLAQEIINARPYAFLDDAPAEERRTLAIQSRRFMDPVSAAELARLDPAAIKKVCAEVWPAPRNADELHDALNIMAFLTLDETEVQPDWRPLFDELCTRRRATCLSTPSGLQLWVAAERLQTLLNVFPNASLSPCISPINESSSDSPDTQHALVETLRSRLEALGPVTETRLVQSLRLSTSEIHTALLALEQEGYALQGNFTPGIDETEWCERGLLARIHRYTLKRMRAEIQPVCAADFMRFLFHWHHLDDPLQGPAALPLILQQLEGFAVAAASWEKDILPSRLADYTPTMLDNLCNAGRIIWQRPPRNEATTKPAVAAKSGRKTGAVKSMPVILIERGQIGLWIKPEAAAPGESANDSSNISPGAESVRACLQQHGALFFDDLLAETNLLPTQAEQCLAELVGQGLVTADSFAGLRFLLNTPKRRYRNSFEAPPTGRWALLRRQHTPDDHNVEHIARTLLRRYGVVFRKLLEREALPVTWRELVYVFRRLEARGEIRGGRFVEGMSGEQYALVEAVTALRKVRSTQEEDKLISICGTDPLNLTSIITPGERIAAKPGNRILYQNGVPIGTSTAGRIEFLESVAAERQWEMRQLLIRQHNPATFIPSPRTPI